MLNVRKVFPHWYHLFKKYSNAYVHIFSQISSFLYALRINTHKEAHLQIL